MECTSTAGPPGPTAIPTLSEWGLIILAGMLFLLAWGVLRGPRQAIY